MWCRGSKERMPASSQPPKKFMVSKLALNRDRLLQVKKLIKKQKLKIANELKIEKAEDKALKLDTTEG